MTRKQPKPKTPKPVDGWAIVMHNGMLVYNIWPTKDGAEFHAHGIGDNVIRVRIVPIVKRKPRTKRRSKP